ncbi:MAG: aspartate aminotransferase family protein [Candidatus Doudnabacteria bacterium]|nr:aspartate aminotransferase family protein [Candidatus Doudnabacteria bacterium]
MTKHLANSGATEINFVRGAGCFLFDEAGKKYIDFLGGWCVATVGWKHPEMEKALAEAGKLGLYVPPSFGWPEWDKFAERLCRLAPGNLSRAFRCTSGSEAVEFAIKLARAATGRKKIISVEGVYHGHTYGAATVGTGLTSAMAPGVPEMQKISLRDGVTEFEKIANGGDVAAFLSEPVFTNAGAIIPPADFYPHIAQICRKQDILLVMDEVATGFGRTGKMFASEHWNLEPDIICLGKAISGGYATLGATLTTEEVFEKGQDIPLYSTFGWMPSSLVVARRNVELIAEEKLVENSAKLGEYMLGKLKGLEKLPTVKEVRGLGLMFGIDLEPRGLSEKIYNDCLQQGLIIDTAHHGTLFFTPPLCLDQKTADQGIMILGKVLNEAG